MFKYKWVNLSETDCDVYIKFFDYGSETSIHELDNNSYEYEAEAVNGLDKWFSDLKRWYNLDRKFIENYFKTNLVLVKYYDFKSNPIVD